MKTKQEVLCKKIMGALVLLATVLFACFLCRIPAGAAEAQEQAQESEPESAQAQEDAQSKAIAIVFDNSGSMYTSTTWCGALYATEVFAAMTDEGDEIGIYPLNAIEAGGATYDRESPMLLQGGDDVSVIREIYSPSSGDTHIETITDAYNGLAEMAGEEKWLVVLTDGDIFYVNGEPLDSEYGEDRSVTRETLSTMLSEYADSVNVMYLGIGEEATIPTIEGSMYSETFVALDSQEILGDMIAISDTIYGREEVEAASGTLELDRPVTDLILFVQGDDIENLRLADAGGEEAAAPERTCSPLFAEAPGSGSVARHPEYYAGNASDPDLCGEIVTYGAIPAGTYTVEYDGTSTSVGVYCSYEPGSLPVSVEETESVDADLAEDAALLEEETAMAEEAGRSFRGSHPTLFWMILAAIIAAAVVVVVVVIVLNQKVLPKKLSAGIATFRLEGAYDYEGKRPYMRYVGGGGKTGQIKIGPRAGVTDFEYNLTLNLAACGKRIKKSGERGAVITSIPAETGYLRSYTIDTGDETYTFTKGEPAEPKEIRLGTVFTCTMQVENEPLPGFKESAEIVIRMEFE